MKPDSRKCSWSFLTERKETAPEILFTPTALKWIKAMAEVHDEEVGFLGLVEEIDGAYVITEIFYPKHCLVSAATCEISPEGEMGVAQRLIDENRVDDVAKVRFWGHSHHTMGTTPSGQDDSQAIDKMNNNGAYFIRAICNKSGEMSVSFFDHARQIKFENIKWSLCYNYDVMMQGVISAVNMESPNKEKISAIRSAVSPKVDFTDKEYKDIVGEVKKLKEENLPKSSPNRSVTQHFHGGWPGRSYQTNVFDDDGHFGPFGGDEFYGRYGGYRAPHMTNNNDNHKGKKKRNQGNENTDNIDPLLSNQEIDEVVNEAWEETP